MQSDGEVQGLPTPESFGVKTEEVHQCQCGNRLFFDWGAELLFTDPQYDVSERFKGWVDSKRVKHCARCHRSVVFHEGKVYDVTEYIPAQQVAELIEKGMSRTHVVPLKVMDP